MTGITDQSRAQFEWKNGDIFSDENGVDALVNTVNCAGVMGRGIALQFKKRFPDNFRAYRLQCERGEMRPGQVFVYEHEQRDAFLPRYIINFPTKRHWSAKSRLRDIQDGLESLADEIRKRGIRSIALPSLGCGLGGLQWSTVRECITEKLGVLDDVRIAVYEPGDPHDAPQQVTTSRQASR